MYLIVTTFQESEFGGWESNIQPVIFESVEALVALITKRSAVYAEAQKEFWDLHGRLARKEISQKEYVTLNDKLTKDPTSGNLDIGDFPFHIQAFEPMDDGHGNQLSYKIQSIEDYFAERKAEVDKLNQLRKVKK